MPPKNNDFMPKLSEQCSLCVTFIRLSPVLFVVIWPAQAADITSESVGLHFPIALCAMPAVKVEQQ